MAWIDFKRAYDMVPHSWIKECLDLVRVAESVKTLLVNGMGKWRVMLCAENLELLSEVFFKILYGFQCLFYD